MLAPPKVIEKNFVLSNKKKQGKVPVIKEMSLFWKGLTDENDAKTRR